MSIYDTLNDRQKEAVLHTEGPLLILAGAGSGKTRVLTHRIAYLIDEIGVTPWNILAITFTNKAAGEMRERVDKIVGQGAQEVWVSTFHSLCVRILRRHISNLGYSENFTIYDSDDQKTLMKAVCKDMDIDTKKFKEKMFLSKISNAKNNLIDEKSYLLNNEGAGETLIAKVYQEYQKRLKSNNALDFDDIIFKTVELFRNCKEVLENYRNRFQYIMVDEYQDTNTAQFQLIHLLADKYKNLCVVGDDDQSIYKFRGANIKNILNFESSYPDAKVIKLEQNYRSTQNILSAANGVIANNFGRKDKALWTENEEGEKIFVKELENGFVEAEFIAEEIERRVDNGCDYKDCAVLYRTNSQSRMIEEKLIFSNIPYRIIGGVNFYSRLEVKDMLAYLKTVDNARDDLQVRRIINVPKRGIGAVSLGKVQDYANARGISFFEALGEAEQIPTLGKAASKLTAFYSSIIVYRAKLEVMSLTEVLENIIEETGYVELLKEENTDESRSRIENIDELISKLKIYEDTAEEPTLSGFLEEVSLVADIDNLKEDDNYVVLMTLHSAKGLEFPNVFIPGMEDGLFPSYQTISSGDMEEVEEERRLCYVGITRAMKHLTLTNVRARMMRGEMQYNRPSRFLKEIPDELKISSRLEGPRPVQDKKPNPYAEARKAFHTKPFAMPKTFGVEPLSELEYNEGDRVRHIKFGEGQVEKIVRGGKDFEVTVNFDRVGVKKMFASFAKLKKI